MKKYIKALTLLILSFICISIVAIIYKDMLLLFNPIPRPQYIISVDSSTGVHHRGVPEIICAEISEHFIWRNGDFTDDISTSITQTAHWQVNGQILESVESPLLGSFHAMTRDVYDINGKTIGSYQSPTFVCFDSTMFVLGIYDIELHFEGTDGTVYGHRWAFHARHPFVKPLRNLRWNIEDSFNNLLSRDES